MMKRGASRIDNEITVVNRVVARTGEGVSLSDDEPGSADGGRTLN
jgi:hypothetical protein